MKRRERKGAMRERISMKWKVFSYLLSFTFILLAMLWLFQICYLEHFYRLIKNYEAENALERTVGILKNSGPEDVEASIESLAAERSLSILVTDGEGSAKYNAEYNLASRMSKIPQGIFYEYYAQAQAQGGKAKIEFEGNQDLSRRPEEQEFPMPEGDRVPEEDRVPGEEGFFQNRGQELARSAIYVEILEQDSEELVVMVNSQLTPVDATVGTLRIQFLLISVILILLSLGIAFLLSRKISRPIVQVSKSAAELAKGNYSVEFSGKDYREIAELSKTLNYAARELEKTEGLRRELIANVSHDLRTPLTMIIAYAEVMRDLPGENTPENIQVVIDESSRLANLVNDMLDISKLQAGVMEKNTAVYNLTESIESVLERYSKLKEQEGYTIEFQYEEEVFAEADEYKIYQVIYNLVNNAINYTGPDRRVTVRQLRTGSRVRIEVADTGEGIAKEDLPYVWDRYYKVDKTHKRTVTGTGLGLSIVKNILILHGARYGVESQPGTGSTFWFELDAREND